MSSPTPKRRDPSPAPEPAKKRRRGATRLSCAECRRSLQSPSHFYPASLTFFVFRLKLRCDRGIPCGSCVKRGCGAICPDGNYILITGDHHSSRLCPGSLTTGQGNRYVTENVCNMFSSNSTYRFVLASTQELHEKITELCSRVRDLEDALRTSHAQNSIEPHPMLSDDLLRVKAPLQREAPPRNPMTINQQEEENNPDVIDSFGTLAINGAGHTSYYSQFANSWVSKQ